VAPARESRRTVFCLIAQLSYVDWPTYESSPLFDRTSLPGSESDVRLFAETRFQHDDHESVDSAVETLLDTAEGLVHIDNVLMDRGVR
jgi:hypothetical protein